MLNFFDMLSQFKGGKKQILLWTVSSGLIFIPGCQTSSSIKQTASEVKNFSVPYLKSEPNDIRSLGNNFYNVKFTIDDNPGPVNHATPVGFIFFNDKMICRCGPNNTSISDSGRYIVFDGAEAKGDDHLMLYDTLNDETITLSSTFLGYPKMAVWHETKRTVRLALQKELGNITLKYFNF